ncbi:MAG: DUF1905 domain-containing protein [Mycobacteriales bacterium]
MELEFSGEVIYWRGPSPWHYVATSDEASAAIESVAREVTYGWGCIPVTATIGGTTWTTSLFPKDERFLVPLKTAVRRAEDIELGDVVTINLDIDF